MLEIQQRWIMLLAKGKQAGDTWQTENVFFGTEFFHSCISESRKLLIWRLWWAEKYSLVTKT